MELWQNGCVEELKKENARLKPKKEKTISVDWLRWSESPIMSRKELMEVQNLQGHKSSENSLQPLSYCQDHAGGTYMGSA
jgi:hypothetical protein